MLLQYIGNHKFDNEYKAVTPCDEDLIIPMNGADILLNPETDDLYTYADLKGQDFMK